MKSLNLSHSLALNLPRRPISRVTSKVSARPYVSRPQPNAHSPWTSNLHSPPVFLRPATLFLPPGLFTYCSLYLACSSPNSQVNGSHCGHIFSVLSWPPLPASFTLLCLITILISTCKCIMSLFACLSPPPKSKLSHQGSFVLVLFTSVFLAHRRPSAILCCMKGLHGSDSSLEVKISGGRTM